MMTLNLPKIDWIAKRHAFFTISHLMLAVAVGSILIKGFNYGIDFVGGTMVQVTYAQTKTLGSLRDDLAKAGFPDASPQSFAGEKSSFGIRLKSEKALDAQAVEDFLAQLQAADAGNAITVDRKEYVGPSVGRHLKKQAITAVVLAMFGIVVYVGFRFHNPIWGCAGIVALAHDVLCTAGLFSLTGKEVDLTIVAALMAIAGYGMNDTIVIFDRMREKLRIQRRESMAVIVNDSINESLSRTILTNSNVIVVVLTLFLFGGQVIHDFALAMLFGGVVGTFTTIAMTTPMVYEWETRMGGRRGEPAGPSPKPPQAPSAPPQAGKKNPQHRR